MPPGLKSKFWLIFFTISFSGILLVPWSTDNLPSGALKVNGIPINEIQEYYVEQDYYFAVGDNRDDSLDSRYWGFVPENFILGEALFTYFSLNLNTWIPRWERIGTILR